MNCRNCRCSTAWRLEPAVFFHAIKEALQHSRLQGFYRDSIQACSAGDGCFPLHIQSSFPCITDQIVDAIHAEGGLPGQQGIPVLSGKVRLQPEHAMHAGGTHLHEALVEARGDEIQRLG